MKDIDNLLSGAIDMHVHAYPDMSLKHPQSLSNRDVIEQCREAGMGGLVLKTHGWPEPALAYQLNSDYDDFTVYASASLNLMAGGPYPWVVDMAIGMGCKMVWLPTWSAYSDHEHTGFGTIAENYIPSVKTGMKEEDFYCLLDRDGNLLPNIKECIALCRDHDIVMGTGHISSEESLAVGRFANDIGYHKLCLTHPRSDCSFNTFEQIKAFAEMGHYVEVCALNVSPVYEPYATMTTLEVKQMIETIGADHCYISTDHFFDKLPSIPEQILIVLSGLSKEGVSYEQLQAIMDNSKKLLA